MLECLAVFLAFVAVACLSYWLGFEHGYDYRQWEEEDER